MCNELKNEEYRRKKWRERIKFDRRNQVNIEEKVLEMRQTFGHLCFECQFKRDCLLRKGGTTVLLSCPHFLQKEMEENHHGRFVSRCQAGSSGTGYQSYGSDRGFDPTRYQPQTGGES